MSRRIYGIRPSLPEISISNLKKYFINPRLYLKKESLIIFVCGGKSSMEFPTGRDTLLKYANKQLTEFRFFQAEQVFSNLVEEEIPDLLSIENNLADYSDCIIIILESPGAFAEIGAFASNERLAKIMLVFNGKSYKEEESFINLGPIKKINNLSKFGRTIHAEPGKILTASSELSSRLSKLKRSYNKNIDVSSYDRFIKLAPKLRMFIIADIINLFSPVKRLEINRILKGVYGKDNKFDIGIELSMLKATKLISIQDGYILRTVDERGSFYQNYGYDYEKERSHIVNYYHKYDTERIKLLLIR